MLLLVLAVFVGVAEAEFLDLPDLREPQELRNKTYLRDIDIPAVKERSSDPSAGPRVAVSEFRIQGLVEYPEIGITREALGKLVESIRFELMGEGTLLESGYTVNELGQISDLLVEIEDETVDRHVSNLEVQKLVWLIREQRGKRGVTLGQIETVASKITTFYRERGFILAKAYIPSQQVRDGVVNLTLLLGHLGEVNVVDNSLYSAEKIRSAFKGLLEQPVKSEAIEERLYLINDFPGINVEGYFEPGIQVGDTRLNVNVKSEQRVSANLRVDNHGSEDTGLYRLYGDIQANNIFGNADYLGAAMLLATEPSNTVYGRVRYATDFFSPRVKLELEGSKNQFVVDQTTKLVPLEINGDVLVASLAGRYVFRRSRAANYALELRYEDIKSDLQIGKIANDTYDEQLHNFSVKYNYDFLQETKNRLHQGGVKLLGGAYDYGADVQNGQEESYVILSAEYSLLTFWDVPFLDTKSRLIWRAEGQFAGTDISEILQFSLVGPTRARGYEPSLFTADDGVYLGLDWVFTSPGWLDYNIMDTVNLKNVLKPFVFADVGYGVQRVSNNSEKDGTGQVLDAGFGVQVAYGRRLQGNLMVAFPIGEKFRATSTPATPDTYRIVFDAQYAF